MWDLGVAPFDSYQQGTANRRLELSFHLYKEEVAV
jgi:hypothetical protein